MKLILKDVRIAFAQIFQPATVNGQGDPAFSASFLFAHDHPCVAEVDKAIDTVGKDKWGAKWPAIKKELTMGNRLAKQDGDLKASYEGYEGNLFISSRNKTRPLVIDRDKTPLTEADGKPYGGCYVNASIEFWAQDNAYGKRINASLRGVQFLRDGDSFSGGGSADVDEFDDMGDGADAGDFGDDDLT